MNNSSIVGISVLSAIFFGSLITLVIVLRKRLRKSLSFITEHQNHGPNCMLVDRMELCCDEDEVGYVNEALDDTIYQDEQWTSNVVELVPHCLGILKTTQLLTEEVIKAVVSKEEGRGRNSVTGLVAAGHMIASHVDAIVKAMYPPLDPSLLEARCCTLVLSVSNLVVATKHLTNFSHVRSFDPLLHDLYNHLKFMKSTALTVEEESSSPPNKNPPPTKKIKTILKSVKEDYEDDDELLDVNNKTTNVKTTNKGEEKSGVKSEWNKDLMFSSGQH